MVAAPAHVMPLRGERGSPSFNQKQPNKLSQYFEQLKHLFTQCAINADNEKKSYVASYVEAEVADSWEALAEYSDANSTYQDFKNHLELYNQVALRYIISNLDRLIGERQHIGIRSLQDLTAFHLQFNAVSHFLIMNRLLSFREQLQSYLHVFDDAVQTQVVMCLQIKHPDHHPSLSYDIEHIYDTAKWVLQGVTSLTGLATTAPLVYGGIPQIGTTSASIGVPAKSEYVKAEQLGTYFSNLSKSIIDAISHNRLLAANYSGNTGPAQGGGQGKTPKCLMCREEHFIRDCAVIEEYIKAGKCRCNWEGKVILGGGGFVPQSIPGLFLRD